MANKSQSNRQKLVFRLDPSQVTPRSPVAAAAKQSGAAVIKNLPYRSGKSKK